LTLQDSGILAKSPIDAAKERKLKQQYPKAANKDGAIGGVIQTRKACGSMHGSSCFQR
jgi:hypothetical protein